MRYPRASDVNAVRAAGWAGSKPVARLDQIQPFIGVKNRLSESTRSACALVRSVRHNPDAAAGHLPVLARRLRRLALQPVTGSVVESRRNPAAAARHLRVRADGVGARRLVPGWPAPPAGHCPAGAA